MLIDTRQPPPEEEPRPVWEPNWRVWSRAVLAALTGFLATQAGGGVSLLLIFTAVYFACRALDEALPYRMGLTEWRQ